MQVMDMLEQMGGIQSLAREFGVSESQAASGALRCCRRSSAASRSRHKGSLPGWKGSLACSVDSVGVA